jgi:phosphoglucosamine mutase
VRFDKHQPNPLDNANIQHFINQKQDELSGEGRVLVRKSGTENLIRVMAEGKDLNKVEQVVDAIIAKLS